MDLEKEGARPSTLDVSLEAPTTRHKPGPKKGEVTRSEKVSCRLTEEEREQGLRYCKAHGMTEAKLLRVGYLWAINQAPEDKLQKFADALAGVPNPSSGQIKDLLKKSGIVFLLMLLCGFAGPTVAKYVLHIYEEGKSIIYTDHNACIYHDGDKNGCEMVPR